MMHGEYTLSFNGHAVFQQSTVKSGAFNEIRSLDAPQITTLYGALTQTASMMGLDTGILEKIALTPPEPVWDVTRNMLIFSAPFSPFDWQPKWVNRDGEYEYMRRLFPRKIFALWRPRYTLHAFAEDHEAKAFLTHSFRLLADRNDGRIGANLKLGYKKKFFGSFSASSKWDDEPLKKFTSGDLNKVRVSEVFSDCPKSFNAVVPLQPIDRVLSYRNIHRERGTRPVSTCDVYAPKSVVLLKPKEANIRWFLFRRDILGVSDLIVRRAFGEQKVKAVQALFLTHENA